MLCRTGENNFHPSGCLVLPPNENLFWKTIIYKNGSHSCMCTYRHSTWLKETTRIKLQIILQVFSVLLIKNRAMPLFKMFTCCRLLFPYGYDSAPWKRSLHPVTLPCRDWLNRHVCILHVVSNQREGTELPILRSLRNTLLLLWHWAQVFSAVVRPTLAGGQVWEPSHCLPHIGKLSSLKWSPQWNVTSKAPTGTCRSTCRVEFSRDQVGAAVNKDTEMQEWPWTWAVGRGWKNSKERGREPKHVAENSYVAVRTGWLEKRIF